MNNEVCIDYSHVKPEHEAIHARLVNWERWARVRPHGWFTHPMFKNFRASKQWEASPHIGTTVDTLDAALIEKSLDHWDMRTGRNLAETEPDAERSLDHWDMRTGRNSPPCVTPAT